MTRTPPPEYIHTRATQLQAALDNRDGDTAAAILRLIDTDGYPDLAHTLSRGLIEAGLRDMATRGTR